MHAGDACGRLRDAVQGKAVQERTKPVGFSCVGENLCVSGFSVPPCDNKDQGLITVDSWVEVEAEKYLNSRDLCADGSCGHCTQVVYSHTSSISCAAVEDWQNQNATLVCLYGEGHEGGSVPYVPAQK